MNAFNKHQAWTDVAVFEDVKAANGVEMKLRDKGFKARVYDDKLFRWFLFLRPPRVTYQVQVREGDLKSADFNLHSAAPELMQKAIHCPSCDSLRIAYPQMTRKFFLPTVVLHLGIIFHVIDHECYCWHCHFTWNLPGENARSAASPAPQS